MAKLTAKQENFVQAYLRTSNQRVSYREAYKSEGMTDNSVDREACLLLQNPKVAQRLEELQERTAKKTETTVESIDAMLNKAFEKAEADPKGHAGMVAAAMGKAKLHGLIINKSEDVTPRRSSAEILARLRQLTSAGNAGRDSDADGRSGEGGTEREAVPTVPGHGTA